MKPEKYNSETGGVEPMSIEGRFHDQRERLTGGMTDEDRKLRLQFLKDQELSPNEPRITPELYEELVNPLRRFVRKPLDLFFEKLNLAPKIGAENAHLARFVTGRLGIAIGFAYMTTYYFMYNSNDWTVTGRWYLAHAREACYPGDPGYPKTSERTKFSDYYDRGFKNSPI